MKVFAVQRHRIKKRSIKHGRSARLSHAVEPFLAATTHTFDCALQDSLWIDLSEVVQLCSYLPEHQRNANPASFALNRPDSQVIRSYRFFDL